MASNGVWRGVRGAGAVAPGEPCIVSGAMAQGTRGGSGTNFPIVCIGGSAGGADAYVRLLRHLPVDMNVAIAIVNHFAGGPPQLHEILPNCTGMRVQLITDGLRVTPNAVFIIPEGHALHVRDGAFQLRPVARPHGWPDVITLCLQSLTPHWRGQLVAVIVSGYDGGGVAALCGIRDAGGITIAQELEAARAPGMPASAIASGCIDFVLAPEEIAQKIVSIARWCDDPAVFGVWWGQSHRERA
jgi:chemotaxis response regulator CheB